MKKLVLASMLVLAFTLQSIAQNPRETQVPMEKLVVDQNQVPTKVVQAVRKDITQGKIIKWYTFPYMFKKYGWQVTAPRLLRKDKKPDQYDVYILLKNGGRIDAVYSSNGKLVRMRELLKNMPLPAKLDDAIASSSYKDWKVNKDKELITVGEEHMKHYVVRLTRDGKKKTLYLNEKGNFLPHI